MNRQTILASIHHRLRESFAETGEERPLGEIVSRVANDVRSGSTMVRHVSVPVVSIEKVAAFVDGHLEETEVDQICEAVMLDNSVLAEIISAVRATHASPERLAPLSPSLSAKLLAMRPSMSADTASKQPAGAGPGPTGEVQRLTGHPADTEGSLQGTAPPLGPQAAAAPIVVVPSPDVESSRGLPAPGKRAMPKQMMVGLLALAATIVVAIVLLSRPDDEPDQPERLPGPAGIVEDSVDSEAAEDQPDAVPDVGPVTDPSPPAPQTGIAENQSDTPPTSDPPTVAEQVDPTAVAVQPDAKSAPIENDEMPVPSDLDPLRDPNPVRIASAPPLSDLRWTEVNGLLAQGTGADDPARSGGTIKWARIEEGSQSTSTMPSARGTRIVALRTLPMSRAKGEFGTNGRIVIAGDTGLRITSGKSKTSAEFDLMYGAVALLNLAEGTTIQLRDGGRHATTLLWQTKASAVINRLAGGFQIQVEDGEIEVNDKPVRSESVRVGNDQSIETVRAPRRLPRWITNPEDTNAVDRMILAQLASTNDLHTSLHQQIVTLTAKQKLTRDDTRALAKLAAWQASLSGPNVFRLAGNRIPAVRLAALNRLAQMPESDPRYAVTWRTIERTVNNQQRVAQTRAWFRLLRSGARPSRTQLDQMLTGLSSRDFAGRALSDFMLRKYVRNPPPFDPTWSGQTLQRAIKIYRDRAGVADRLTPNAAAAGVAPP